jgi:eukaryotic-like serine/threonine-protein kinase
MTNPPDREVAVFSAARRLPIGERAAYLDEACAGDAALRQRVEELVEASEDAGAFLQSAAVNPPGRVGTIRIELPPSEKAGDKIGHYKLLQQIGEGGCGVVYMAEQEEPVKRRVALKVIKLGMDTKSVIARFAAERQALALMDHPNIAKVLDAGATDTGRPYFVMELVRGIKITDYCDQNNLSTKARLDLFIKVCQAIQHAHQKGIIHRDIKPSNILVTMNDGLPMPKVIDFGIAKATQGKLTDHTVFTAFEQFIGTPAYMSPEQAEMSVLDVDTRSDIYSLGVLLYELLTGKTPFDAKKLLQAGLDEIRRTIREDEPSRPSTRLSTMLVADLTTVAAQRQAQPPKLIHLVRGDLDWIVMKALEKDRTRRYETANGFATDIQRHLNCEPVIARPPSRLYEFQKTVRRHKFGFAAGAAVIMVLAVGVIVSTSEAIRARRAESEQIRLRQVAEIARANEMAIRRKLEYRLQISRASELFNAGKPADAEKLLNGIHPESFEPLREEIAVRRLLAWEYAKEDHWTDALTNLAAIIKNESPHWDGEIANDHYFYSTALVIVGDLAGYTTYRQELATRLFNTNDAGGSEFLCRLALLTPGEKGVIRSLTPFADVAMNRTNYVGDRIRDAKAWNRLILALFAFRDGDNTNALKWIADCLVQGNSGDPTVAPCAHAVRAMALYQMGQADQAKLEISAARKILDPVLKQGVSKVTQNEGRWFEWQQVRIYFNEADRMVTNSVPAGSK